MAAFDFLSDALARLLAFFYSVIPSYAVSIVLLTLLVMIILTPLTLKGTRSMMMMQQLQPEMRKIQNKYKDDRQKLNEELLAFYKENNINPMGGCLPLIAQMPVFFILYSVLRGLTRRESTTGLDSGWVTGQSLTGAELTDPPTVLRDFDPAYLDKSSDLYQSLSGRNDMDGVFGLLDLSQSASQTLSSSFVSALPYLVLIAIVAVSGYVQQKQIQGRTPKSQVNPQQQMLMKITPIMLPVFSFGLPAGLVLYFVVSNLYRIGQQWFITRSIYGLKRGETIDDKRVIDSTATEVDDRPSKAITQKKGAPTPSAKKAKGDAKSEEGWFARAKREAAEAQAAKAKSGGSKGGSSRSGAKGGTKGGAKSGSKGAGSKAGGRASGKKQSAGKAKATSQSQPVLQPRARKQKKR